jgi:hypothetical protein
MLSGEHEEAIARREAMWVLVVLNLTAGSMTSIGGFSSGFMRCPW